MADQLKQKPFNVAFENVMTMLRGGNPDVKIPMRPDYKPRLYPESFPNIVEKQKYWDQMGEKYGTLIQGHEGALDLWDKPLPEATNYDEISLGKAVPVDLESAKVMRSANISPKVNELLDRYSNVYKSIQSLSQNYDLDEAYKKKKELDSITDSLTMLPENEFKYKEKGGKSWKELLGSRKDIDDKALLYSSMMSEGAEKMTEETSLRGFSYFGLDTFGNRLDELIKKGYLPDSTIKQRIQFEPVENEKQAVVSANFENYNDVISAKNAMLKLSRDNVENKAKEMGVRLPKEVSDLFTLMSYNMGDNGVKKAMEYFKSTGALKDNSFDWNFPKKYQEPFRNALKRLALANAVKGELGVE